MNRTNGWIPAPSRAFISLRTAAALGCALVALAGCGGGSDDAAPPPAPGLAAPTNFTFELNFRWTATPGATRYELHVDPDGPGPLPETKAADGTNDDWRGFRYQPRGSQRFTGTFYDPSNATLDLAGRINATYRLRACDANGCGTFTAPIAQEYSYEFPSGRVPIFHSLSKDGLTLAIGQPSAGADSTVAVFTRSSRAHPWQQQALLRSGNAQFGAILALSDDGNTLASPTVTRRAATTMTVTKPAPIFSLPMSCTFADLTMASAASTAPTRPLVSTIPRAIMAMSTGIMILPLQ